MSTTEKIRSASFIMNLIFIPAAFLFLWLWLHKPCPPCYESRQTVTVTEVVPVKDSTLKPISVKVPEAWAIVPKSKVKKLSKNGKSEVAKADTIHITNCDTTIIMPMPICDDVAYYSDTITGDSIRAVINDTLIDNRIAGRSVWMVNLKPDTRITTTVVKREKWKVYVGANFTINQREGNRWGAGPAALVAIPKVGGFGYYFDAKNFSHTASFLALIRFKK